jgi:hypothetical protein
MPIPIRGLNMSEVYKPVGGAIIGVTIPIAIEFAAKGARISDTIPYKWSGVVGTVLGLGEIGIAYAGNKRRIGWPSAKEDVAMMAAMGGAKLATGVSILILDELRKRALYTFKGGQRLPLTEEEYERKITPTSELVEEI